MPLPVDIQRPARERLPVILEPAHNAIASMMLVVRENDMPGVHEWVSKTRAALTAKQFEKHKLVIIGFFYALLPREHWNSFPEYLDHLASVDAQTLRSNLLEEYANICIECGETPPGKVAVDWEAVLSSAETYIQFLKEHFGEKGVDVELETQAYRLVLDPPAMKNLIVRHLRWFWEQFLVQEWTRVEPVLRESTRQFQSLTTSHANSLEEASFITGQELPEEHWKKLLESGKQVWFVPNAHIGPYVYKMIVGDSLWVIFGARQPESADVRIPELDRADIVARVSALADDTRLRILQMIGEQGELRSQDIMEQIELSQPSVSRYLTQLTVTGYLRERRINGAKAYTLNRERIEKNLKAIQKFLLGT
jgi:DNA-binding transcriptional ArsR family regulator